MPTRNINLADHLERFINAGVGSGRCGNATEVVREGLRLLERHKQEDRAKLKWLRGAVRQGLDEIDRGEGMEFAASDELDDVIDRISENASATARKG